VQLFPSSFSTSLVSPNSFICQSPVRTNSWKSSWNCWEGCELCWLPVLHIFLLTVWLLLLLKFAIVANS